MAVGCGPTETAITPESGRPYVFPPWVSRNDART